MPGSRGLPAFRRCARSARLEGSRADRTHRPQSHRGRGGIGAVPDRSPGTCPADDSRGHSCWPAWLWPNAAHSRAAKRLRCRARDTRSFHPSGRSASTDSYRSGTRWQTSSVHNGCHSPSGRHPLGNRAVDGSRADNPSIQAKCWSDACCAVACPPRNGRAARNSPHPGGNNHGNSSSAANPNTRHTQKTRANNRLHGRLGGGPGGRHGRNLAVYRIYRA